MGKKTLWIACSSLLGAKKGFQSDLKQLLVLYHWINGFISVSKLGIEETFYFLLCRNVYTGSWPGAAGAQQILYMLNKNC